MDPDIEQFRKLPEEARVIFEKAERLELFSIEPIASKEKKSFHGYKLLGKTIVKDADICKKIVAAVKTGIAESSGGAGCFHPRHGIRAIHEGKTVDLVICFECLSIQVFAGEKAITFVWTTGSPQKILDKVLRDAKVPLASKPKKDCVLRSFAFSARTSWAGIGFSFWLLLFPTDRMVEWNNCSQQ